VEVISLVLFCVTLIGTMEGFELLHGDLCSICAPSILFTKGLCVGSTVMVQLFNVAPTVMELIKNNNLLSIFTSVFEGVLKMSLNQRGTVSVEHEAIRHKVCKHTSMGVCQDVVASDATVSTVVCHGC
jgi:hypothetical protein